MACFRPSLENLDQLVNPLNSAEMAVANELANLDNEWTVYVQPRIGQDLPTFVAVHDLAGVCAFEVKDWKPDTVRLSGDGSIEHCDAQGEWSKLNEQPRFQASRYRSTIYDQYFAMPIDGTETTEAVRAAVVLPNFSNTQALELLARPAAGDAQRAIAVWGLEGLREQLDQVVRGIGCAHPRPESIVRLKQHLVASEMAAELAAPAKRSVGAARIEMNQGDIRIRRFRGPAGSSKSFGLTGRAARLASQGKRVLVLTFNVTLANHLSGLVGERCREYGANPTLVTCANFHSFCTRAVQDAEQIGYETTAPKGVVWPLAIVAKATQAFKAGYEDRFDAVLVDEGQDFTAAWWNLLREHVVTPDGEMLLMVDPTQDIYNKEAWTDEDEMRNAGFSEPWTDLSGSYRMPSDALALANEFAENHLGGEVLRADILKDHDAVVGAQAGSVRRWRTTDAIGDVGREVGREVVRLLQDNPSLKPRDVAFLCEYHHDGVIAVAEIEAAGYPVHHIFSRDPDDARRRRKYRFWPDADAVKGCTVHSFKGWQTEALVMGLGLERRSKLLAYVAMTRLKAAPADSAAYISVISADTYIADLQDAFEAGPVPVVTKQPSAETPSAADHARPPGLSVVAPLVSEAPATPTAVVPTPPIPEALATPNPDAPAALTVEAPTPPNPEAPASPTSTFPVPQSPDVPVPRGDAPRVDTPLVSPTATQTSHAPATPNSNAPATPSPEAPTPTGSEASAVPTPAAPAVLTPAAPVDVQQADIPLIAVGPTPAPPPPPTMTPAMKAAIEPAPTRTPPVVVASMSSSSAVTPPMANPPAVDSPVSTPQPPPPPGAAVASAITVATDALDNPGTTSAPAAPL